MPLPDAPIVQRAKAKDNDATFRQPFVGDLELTRPSFPVVIEEVLIRLPGRGVGN